MPESTFWQDVDRLTTANHKIVHRERGTEVLTTHGLIQQLRSAIEQGREAGGASSSFGSRPPIDAGAADLLREIGGQARVALQAATGQPAPFGGPEKHIRLWAAAVNESTPVTVFFRRQVPDRVVDQWIRDGVSDRVAVSKEPTLLTAKKLVKHWIDRIEGFFYPPDTREIKAPCPICDERFVYREKDGETVQSSALTFVREGGEIVDARCAACGLRWAPTQFEWLAKAIGATADVKALREMGVVLDTPEETSEQNLRQVSN